VVETPRRREIEDVASVLFREHGYSGTSVRDIARALDIRGASLYAHVASKQDVLWSIIDRMASRFEIAAADALAAASTPGAGPGERLMALVRAHVGVVADDVGRATVFVHEWRSVTGERHDQIVERRDRYEERFRAVIAEGVATGTFAPIDPEVAAAFTLTALNGIVAWYQPAGRIGPTDLADLYADLALHAVLATDGRREVPAGWREVPA
jgi:AcrR family transcriptional regulator